MRCARASTRSSTSVPTPTSWGATTRARAPRWEPGREALREGEHEIVALGTDTDVVRIDYPVKSAELGATIKDGEAERGVLVCGSGVGAAVAACKIIRNRRAVCHASYSPPQGVEHDDMNVLCLGSEVVGPSLAADLVRTFLAATFIGEGRYLERLKKVKAMERAMAHG